MRVRKRPTKTKQRPGWKPTRKIRNVEVTRCQAQKHAGGQCGQPAEGGKPVCKFHGARAGRPKNPMTVIIEGATGTIRQHLDALEEARKKIPVDCTDLSDEIMMAQAAYRDYVASNPPPEDASKQVWMASKVAEMKKQQAEIDDLRKGMVSLEVVRSVIAMYYGSVLRIVKDPVVLRAILNEGKKVGERIIELSTMAEQEKDREKIERGARILQADIAAGTVVMVDEKSDVLEGGKAPIE